MNNKHDWNNEVGNGAESSGGQDSGFESWGIHLKMGIFAASPHLASLWMLGIASLIPNDLENHLGILEDLGPQNIWRMLGQENLVKWKDADL